jgi:hypothetical protein
VSSIPGTVLQPAGDARRGRGPRRRPTAAGTARAAVAVVAGAVVGGAAMGLAWRLLAPTARAQVQGGQIFLQGHQELQVAQDGWFAVVVGAAGVLLATVLALRPSRRPAVQAVTAALALGLSALVAWRVGTWLGPEPLQEQVRAGTTRPLTPLALRMPQPLLLVGPLLFSLTRFVAALLTGDPAADEPGR